MGPSPAPLRLLMAALVLSGGLGGGLEAATHATVDLASRQASIGNGNVERVLTLDEKGRFRSLRFATLDPAVEWVDPASPSVEFRLQIRQESSHGPHLTELSGESDWRLAGYDARVLDDGTAVLSVSLDSVRAPVRVSLRYEAYPEAPVIRTTLDVLNRGSAPITLVRATVPDLQLGEHGEEVRLFVVRNFTWSHVEGALLPQGMSLADGQKRRFPTGPYGTHAAWFALRTAASGYGLFGGWEWSGSGEMTFESELDRVEVGLGLPPGFEHQIAPGETFSAPPAFLGLFRGDWDDAAHATRALVEARYAPPLPTFPFPYVAFDTWGYGMEIDEGLVHGLIDQAADLGVELFTLDAGWSEGLGDWVPRTGRFDGGIEAIARHVHARGMKFGLWVAFGAAYPGSSVLTQHPDWAATADGAPFPDEFGGVGLCLANPPTRAWVQEELDRIVDRYQVDLFLHDFEVIEPCDDPGHGHQRGDGDWATTAGYYAILDELRRRHPGLLVENCWDGGSMLDFGMVRRHDTTNLNDYNEALGNRLGVFSASYFLPPRYLEKYVGDDGSPDSYRFLAGVPGGPMILMGSPTDWAPGTRRAAADAIALFKSLRTVLRDGKVDHLSYPPGPVSRDVLSFSMPGGDGAVFAFRESDDGGPDLQITLPRLDSGATYAVSVNTDLIGWMPLETTSGSGLGSDGITVSLPSPRSAAVVRLSRVQ